MSQPIYLVASGDLRLSANQTCWPAQKAMEDALAAAFKAEGRIIKRAHPYDAKKKHGFIASQREGIEVFRGIPPDAPLIVAEAIIRQAIADGVAMRKDIPEDIAGFVQERSWTAEYQPFVRGAS